MADNQSGAWNLNFVCEDNLRAKAHRIHIAAGLRPVPVFSRRFGARPRRIHKTKGHFVGSQFNEALTDFPIKKAVLNHKVSVVCAGFDKHRAQASIGQTIFGHEQVGDDQRDVERDVLAKHADTARDEQRSHVQHFQRSRLGSPVDMIREEPMRVSVSENCICGPVHTMVRVHDLSAVRCFEVDGFTQPFEVVKGAGQNNGNRLIHEVIMGEQEGVIKFELDHREGPLSEELAQALGPLVGWRRVMFDLGMVGQNVNLYGGLGYGNVSVRVDAMGSFLVSGSQTSGAKDVTSKDFAFVESFDRDTSKIVSRGEVRPSSESMTHAVLYKTDPNIRCVLHAHDTVIWDYANDLGLSSTPDDVEYGTSEMVLAVQAIARRLGGVGVFSMGGHRDGIIAFGRNEDEAGKRLVAVRARAHAMEYRCPK